ncbi:MAG: ribosome silencing factor [Bacteroidales bacterium]
MPILPIFAKIKYLDVNDDKKLIESIIEGIRKNKGQKIAVIDFLKINHSEYTNFIICQGRSNTQVSAIAGSVEQNVKDELGEMPTRVEGKQQGHWVLISYGNIIVHVFREEAREFYNLEGLWADADIVNLKDE